MDKDILKDAKERFDACKDATNDQREEMLDDLRFSNPADPQQWPDVVRTMREQAEGGPRPCLTFDQTNQFISQVVNDSRRNKPSIKIRPVDSGADVKVAEALTGIMRHIEDVSRADIAYDTALEYAARMGLGWMRVTTRVSNDATNEQDIIIGRIADQMSVHLDPDWQEPDGSDAMFGFVESSLTHRAFDRQYPDAEIANWVDGDGWTTDKTIRLCEYFDITEAKTNMLCVADPINIGQEICLPEEDYWAAAKESGYKPPVLRTYWAKKRKTAWYKLTGTEILEQSEFPASYVPLIPVIGSELWIEGKRHLCGLVRPMKDPQRAYNYDRSNYIEHVSLQTKIPYLAAAEALEGYEAQWAAANRSNAAYLPYNHIGSDGQSLPAPSRIMPPQPSQAFAQGSQLAQNDIQAAIGMYRANLGAPSNETSGKAIDARKMQGETANFHYSDNMSRSLRHLGKIIIEMMPRVIDTKRDMRILGDDGTHSLVTLDPSQPQAAVMKDAALVSFNPAVGKYDVAVTVGASFGTRRQEALQALTEMVNGNPQMMALMGDEIVRLMDIPQAEKISARLAAMLPSQVQQAEAAAKGGPTPEVQAVTQQAQQAIQERDHVIQGLQQHAQQLMDAEKDKQADRDNAFRIEQVKAWAEVETAKINAMAKEGQNVQGQDVAAMVESMSQLANQLGEQNGHMFLAMSQIAEQMANQPQGMPPPQQPMNPGAPM